MPRMMELPSDKSNLKRKKMTINKRKKRTNIKISHHKLKFKKQIEMQLAP
jgi:hypothetical protein